MDNTLQLIMLGALLVILAEVTFLASQLPRQTIFKRPARQTLIDTSVLIDGRIVAICKTGFFNDTLVIPRSVVGELQLLADTADPEKRARARQGLDIVTELQNMPDVTVELLQDGSRAREGVDERLLTLAKKRGAAICTIDYNLNKVAVVEGITVLNINELAQNLRMSHLPGEKALIELVQKGQDAHQGVGYLPDGTMVVVEQASSLIGQTVEIEFIRSLQTAAGRMMFARMAGRKDTGQNGKKPQPQGRKNVKQPKHETQPQAKREAPAQSVRPPKPQAQQPSRRHAPRDREDVLIDLVDKQ